MENTLNFSKIIAGTMTWGKWGKNFTAAQMQELLNYCVNIDITTFDHADIYGDYTNEAQFGKALKSSQIKRENIQLISKCGIQMTKGRPNKVKHYQYDYAYIVQAAEQSLKNLQTEYLDLFLLHRPSPLMHPGEITKAIQTLIKQGKIRHFGVSNFTPSQIALLETEIAVQANQVQFSLTHTQPMYDGTFDDCIMGKRTAMAWSPLGNIFKPNTTPNPTLQTLLGQLSEKYNLTTSQILLAFVLKHPALIYPVVGTTSKERLKQSIEAVTVNVELQDWFLLLEASLGHRVP